MKYKTKPCVIEAEIFRRDFIDELVSFTHGAITQICVPSSRFENAYAIIETLEGDMRAEEGDYIIRGLRGEYYPCKPDVFAQKYDLMEN